MNDSFWLLLLFLLSLMMSLIHEAKHISLHFSSTWWWHVFTPFLDCNFILSSLLLSHNNYNYNYISEKQTSIFNKQTMLINLIFNCLLACFNLIQFISIGIIISLNIMILFIIIIICYSIELQFRNIHQVMIQFAVYISLYNDNYNWISCFSLDHLTSDHISKRVEAWVITTKWWPFKVVIW